MTGIRVFIQEFLFVLGDARRQVPGIFALFLFAAMLDLCGLGMILPLITAITVPASALNIKLPFIQNLGALNINLLAAGVVVIYISRAIIAYWVQRTIARFGEGQRGQLMTRLLHAYLHKPYEFHLERNSAVLINNTINLTWGYTAGVLTVLLRLATDLVTFAVILGFLAWANWQVVVAATTTLILVLAVYNRIAKGTLSRSGEMVAASQAKAVRTLNHALGAIREVRVLGIEQHAVDEMHQHALRLAQGAGQAAAIMTLPRYLIETSLIVLLASLAILLHSGTVVTTELIPTLGLFAIAAIRLMPGTTSIIGAVNSIRHYRYALRQLAADLKVAETSIQTPSTEASLSFSSRRAARGRCHVSTSEGGEEGAHTSPLHASLSPSPTAHHQNIFRGFKTIEFAGVTYSYPTGSNPALNSVDLTIQAGQAIGVIGRSGAGKSTLADILLGLIRPQAGQILVDGKDIHDDARAWMNELAYIPQAVFINDDTLRANIAFGVSADQVDENQLKAAVAASQLQEAVKGLPKGLETMLGERGVRLSGGQRQRVALARALYHDRQLIVMDEATAALDTETEQEVIRAIRTLHGKKTLIIIAHRHSTLVGCDLIVSIENGRATQIGNHSGT